MRRFLMTMLVVIVGALGTFPVIAATRTDSSAGPYTANATIAARTNLEVFIKNVSDDENASGISFDTADVRLPGTSPSSDPWAGANQYLLVKYSSNYGLWGVQIVTDNEDLEEDNDGEINKIQGEILSPGDDGEFGTSDDVKSYAGLYNLEEIQKAMNSQDPNNKASWVWQVYSSKQSEITQPTSKIASNGALTDGDDVGEWNDPWAYLIDKNNTDYKNVILEDADGDGKVNDPTYQMVVVGSGGSNGSLAQHPASDTKPGNINGIYIYLSARFANTNWEDSSNPVAHTLGAGEYNASLYVELVHE